MRTEELSATDARDVARAAALLREGRVVAFPTETVYGLGARADDDGALAELRRLKWRPEQKRFALLVASAEDLNTYAQPDGRARRLAHRFWPGPLTLVVPDGRDGDVGLRCPDMEVTRQLLRLAGCPVAATSANRSGEAPAGDAQQVLDCFAGELAAVVDGGPVRVGVASTVVRLTGQGLEVLRRGPIAEQELRAALRG